MKIIISPAKQMQVDTDTFDVLSEPQMLSQAEEIMNYMKSLTTDELKKLWHTSDKLFQLNAERLKSMDLKSEYQTPAILAFCGLQYQYMAPDLFTQPALDYIQQNMRILSGFYGMLRPFDGVCPYRLELNTKMVGFRDYSLYHFWGSDIAENLFQEDNIVIDLASKQYT